MPNLPNGRYTAPVPDSAPVETAEAAENSPGLLERINFQGAPFLLITFVLSLLAPVQVRLGPVLLLPYRLWLLVLFVPLFFKLVGGKVGKMVIIDWMMLGSAAWAALAMAMNHPVGTIIEPAGVQMIETFGAYMLARVAIRSAEDFVTMVRVFMLVLFILLPFALLEAVSHNNYLLKMIPKHIEIVNPTPRFGLRRVQSVFAHPIHYGAFVSAAFGLAWFAFLPTAGFFTRCLLALAVAVSTFLSLSTAALLAVLIQGGLIGYELLMRNNPNRWRLFTYMFIAGYILGTMMVEKSLFHTLVHKATFSSQSGYTRILIFEYGVQNVWANPLFGLGFNDWERPRFMSPSVDNFWLLHTMRFGLPSFLMLAGAVTLIIRRVSRQPLLYSVDRACRAGFLVTICGVIIAGGTVDYWKGLLSFVLFLFGAGVWIFTGGARVGTAAASDTGDAGTMRPPPKGRR